MAQCGKHTVRLLLACILLSGRTSPCFAAPSSPAEIVVTARRQAEVWSSVPLAVDVIAMGQGGADRVHSLQDVAAGIPGLSFEAIWGGANSFPVLRGQNPPSIAGDNVGMFVDGVYQANRDAIDVEPLDLQRIEVVHGPQSAMFGHSTFAGVIAYVPAEPTERLAASSAVDFGTDGYRGIGAMVSGPLGSFLKARVAGLGRDTGGTWRNGVDGRRLGSSRRLAVTATLASRDGAGPLTFRLSGRYGHSNFGQPPFYTLDLNDYNCGGRDAVSGAWSYFCGKAPISTALSLSTDLPESRTRTGQVALHLDLDLGPAQLRSDTSWYGADTDAYRDFDGSVAGALYGVCVVGLNCAGGGNINLPVVRLQRVNIAQRRSIGAREWAQELRLEANPSQRFTWSVGFAAYWSRTRTTFAYGAERGVLLAGEQFSSPVYSNLLRVGQPAAINAALSADPNGTQFIQNESVERRRNLAVFGSAQIDLGAALRLRGELRATWERVSIDSRMANFAPSFGTTLPARDFRFLTPRISLDFQPVRGLLIFASYARGAKSGGVNAYSGLRQDEQAFEPETNWTTELGAKYAGSGMIREAHLTLYDIDWRNTQILGLATSPGVTALIIRNTAGIHTRGIEAGTRIVPIPWLALDIGWSYSDPRFKAGSEDPGSGAYCGLSPGVITSTFCTLRISTINPGQLVPDIGGKVPSRAVRSSWSAGVTIAPQWRAVPDLALRADVTHQSDIYDRHVNGMRYGARTLVNARVSLPLGRFELAVWGTNLTDRTYVRASAGRPPAFYIGVPRPSDMILGDRRRIGATLRYTMP